jgi:exodeoxyribonuclease V gamma subunit
MLLDALMAATDRLIVTYTGNDERTNAPRPPAVPVGELLDVVDRTVRTGDGTNAREHVLVRHPLQPFDPRNFARGALVPDRTWSFDRVTLEGARALDAPRSTDPPFLDAPLPDDDRRVVELEDLVRFVQHPVRAFLRQRLGISVGDFSEEIDDALPIELNPLEQWSIGQRLVEARLAGADLDACVAAELARGVLPPGRLADELMPTLKARAEQIVGAAHSICGADAAPVSVDARIALEDGRLVSGTVPGLCGDVVRAVTYSRVGPRHRLAAWVRWLALVAAHPDRAYEAVTVGRARTDSNDAEVTIARLPPIEPEVAREQLSNLVALRDRGLREPLALPCDTAAAYAASGEGAAAKAWESEFNRDREDKDLEHQLVFGGVLTFAQLLERNPQLGDLAHGLWDGVLAHESLEDA